MKDNIAQRAKEFAELMHKGQKRKDGIPFITHPAGVVKILKREGISDERTISIAWLHDTIEDTVAEYEDLEKEFGKEIADRVYILSRNISREEYKARIKNSDYVVKVVKLADTLHNVHNPYSMCYLSPAGIQRKIVDCRLFYIPLAMDVFPILGYMLKKSIDNYLKIFGGNTDEDTRNFRTQQPTG